MTTLNCFLSSRAAIGDEFWVVDRLHGEGFPTGQFGATYDFSHKLLGLVMAEGVEELFSGVRDAPVIRQTLETRKKDSNCHHPQFQYCVADLSRRVLQHPTPELENSLGYERPYGAGLLNVRCWRRSRYRRPAADPTLVYEDTTQGLKALTMSGGQGTYAAPPGPRVPFAGAVPPGVAGPHGRATDLRARVPGAGMAKPRARGGRPNADRGLPRPVRARRGPARG